MPDANTEDFAAEAERFVDELKDGVPIAKAIESVNDVVHHPDVVAAGVAMLASDGSIDMKRLATDAGISRASLYRYYPDKGKLEGEIAGRGLEGMVAVANEQVTVADKFRAAATYLIDNPGEAAAMVPFAAMVSVSVLSTTIERLTGAAAATPFVIGIAVMAATPGREPGDEATLRGYVDACAAALA